MFKRNEYSIIKRYTYKLIDSYYDNKFINKSTKSYIKKCMVAIKNSDEFLHITPKYEDIISSEFLGCSSGGLGGVVYAVPIAKNGLIHNLGTYIITKELPMFLNNNSENINGIVIVPNNKKIGCVDYLDFGKWYYYIFKKNKYPIEKANIEQYANEIIDKVNKIITLSDNPQNINEIFEIMSNSSVLKTFLFECIVEYLLLFQKNRCPNSMNNDIVKDIIYNLCPALKEKFSLSNFSADYNTMHEIIENRKNFYTNDIEKYFTSRINFFLKKYIIDDSNNLYGHIIFRNFNIRRELESEFSKMLWEEAKRKKYSVLSYIIPKGEVGILPNGNNKIFQGNICKNFCSKKDELKIEIRSIIFKNGIMRNPYDKEDNNGTTN